MDRTARIPERPRLSWWAVGLAVAFFALPAAAVLTFLGVEDETSGAEGLEGASGVAASFDGRHLYVTGTAEDSLVVFRRGDAGELQFAGRLQAGVGGVFGLDGASAVATSRDGRHVYVTGEFDDALAVLVRSADGDDLTFHGALVNARERVFGLDGASDVAVSPDDRNVYATGGGDNSLVVFSRDATTDDLAFVELHENGVRSRGLGGASAVTVSPDGAYVYATGSFDDSVAVFRRRSNGRLTFSSYLMDGLDGVGGLDGASDVAVSPDGRHLYVTGRDADALAAFEQDGRGRLAPVQVVREGAGRIRGLVAPAAVTVSRDGRHVFVAGRGSDSLAIFRRDPATGAVSFYGALSGGDGVMGLDGVSALAWSPAGDLLYAAGSLGNSVAVFLHGYLELRRPPGDELPAGEP